MKRILAALLTMVLLLALLPAGMVAASSRPLTLKELQKMYPSGAYWNHTGTANNPLSYTWTPCYHHGGCTYSGSCGCNSYEGKAIQCMGFAYQLASLAYDCDPRSEWDTNYSTAALNKLKAGDIVRYKYGSHSIFITAVDGDTVTYADGNGDNHCQIQWGQTITKAKLKSSFSYVKAAPYALDELHAPASDEHVLTIRYHAGGGKISDAIEAHQYMVTDPDGVNMRANAGTGNAILTALPIGTVFTVKVGDTKTANGYTWGKTTVDKVTGWVVISDFVTKTTDLSGEDYYLMDSVVYRADTAAPVTRTVTMGEYVKLSNPATFNLTNGKRPFLGWTAYPEDAEPLYSWDVTKLKAEVLCPELLEQDVTLTLYAVWGCAHEYVNACAEKCSLCGARREPIHAYAAACSETCSGCGTTRTMTNHRFKDKTCTVCGKVKKTLAITTQPKTEYTQQGKKTAVTVGAVGDGLKYTWYLKNAGKTKFSKSSITTATYGAMMRDAVHGRQVYCVVTDAYGDTVQSKTVTLYQAATILTQPKTGYAQLGEKADTTVEAVGEGLTYTWYIKNAGASKFSKSSVTKATYATVMRDAAHGRQVYCVVTDAYGKTAKTETVTLYRAATVVTHPKNVVVNNGASVKTTVEAVGDDLTYTWYIKNAGASKFSKSSIKKATYATTMSEKVHGRQLYCVVTDTYGKKAQSATVTFSSEASIITQPKTGYARQGEKATTTVDAIGDDLKYTWYIKNAGASKFSKSSVTKATYATVMRDAAHGRQVYCVITDAYGNTAKTETVTLYHEVTIVSQPQDVVAKNGVSAKTAVKAVGGGLTYTWYFKNVGMSTFNESAVKKATYTTTMSERAHGRQVYCIVTDRWGNTVQSKTITLKMK